METKLRLTYRLVRPGRTARELAMAGLPTLDGEFVGVYLQKGDSDAGIIARVRDESWERNPEVWGSDSREGGSHVFFGHLRQYLQDDPRFRILVLPVSSTKCDGDMRVTFLPYGDTTGYLVWGASSENPENLPDTGPVEHEEDVSHSSLVVDLAVTDRPASSLEDLASPDSATRSRGASRMFGLALKELSDEHDLLDRFSIALSAEWRAVGGPREALVPGLVTTLTEEKSLLTIEIAAMALAAQGEDGLTALVDLLDHRDFAIRSKAVIAIGLLDRSARWAVPTLIRAISRESVGLVVADLIRALGRIGGTEATNALVALLANLDQAANPDDGLKADVVRALAHARLESI